MACSNVAGGCKHDSVRCGRAAMASAARHGFNQIEVDMILSVRTKRVAHEALAVADRAAKTKCTAVINAGCDNGALVNAHAFTECAAAY